MVHAGISYLTVQSKFVCDIILYDKIKKVIVSRVDIIFCLDAIKLFVHLDHGHVLFLFFVITLLLFLQ